MRARDFYDLVSGKRRGLLASLLRLLLLIAEGPYRIGVWWRNRRYDTKPELSHQLDVPVISVGNLTLGGTGKTPMVKWLATWFRQQGIRVTLVSRGYGADERGVNDEALELEDALPDVPHLQNPDRVEAGRVAVDELASQLILLDDGFQHRRLRRDLDIVLIDATEPFGFEHVFPRGALREPISSLKRADIVCLTRSNMVDESKRSEIRERVNRYNSEAVWCESIVKPVGLLPVDENGNALERIALDQLNSKPTLAFCGLGNPEAFLHTVETLGAKLVATEEYPDHHGYKAGDIQHLGNLAKRSDAEVLVCSHKDLVKVRVPQIQGVPLYAIMIGAEIIVGEKELTEKLNPLVERSGQIDGFYEEGFIIEGVLAEESIE